MARISGFGMTITRRPKSPKYQFEAVRSEIRGALVAVAAEHVRRRMAIVANWKPENQPSFESSIEVSEPLIIMQIQMANLNAPLGRYGRATVGDLWRWLDRTGTKPHMIYPLDPRGVLRFTIGGEVFYRKWVRHPGFPPRHWTDEINSSMKTEFDKNVDNAIRRGFRKAMDGGSR